MSRQNIFTGSVANDGTGDSLRQAAIKINANFVELYQRLGGDSDVLSSQISFTNSGIVFEGSSIDSNETTITVTDPTADRTITFPDASGGVIITTATQTLSNKTILSPELTTPSIKDADSSHSYDIVVGNLSADRNINLPVLTDSDTFVFENHSQTLTNKTLSSPIINTARVGTSLNDTNGAELIKVTATGSAVNEVTIANAATGSGPSITATGDDTNINLVLGSKGTGAVRLNTKTSFTPETKTSSGAISLLVPLTILNSGSALAMTLANGTVAGESKRLINIGAGIATVTPTTYAQGTSFSLRQHGSVEAIWTGSTWYTLIDDNYDSSDNTYIYVTT